MRYLIIGLLVTILICACRKDKSYQMQIFIKNNTTGKLQVTLFPNSKYMHGGLYDFCDFGGGYADTTFTIDINDKHWLYISGNIDQTPYDLTSLIFDSIYVKRYDNLEIIKFSDGKVVGYTDNLFENNSNWLYKKNNYSEHTSLSTHYIESHDYFFEISN